LDVTDPGSAEWNAPNRWHESQKLAALLTVRLRPSRGDPMLVAPSRTRDGPRSMAS